MSCIIEDTRWMRLCRLRSVCGGPLLPDCEVWAFVGDGDGTRESKVPWRWCTSTDRNSIAQPHCLAALHFRVLFVNQGLLVWGLLPSEFLGHFHQRLFVRKAAFTEFEAFNLLLPGMVCFNTTMRRRGRRGRKIRYQAAADICVCV